MYNPQNAKETAQLPKDSILDGVINTIKDGIVKEFVLNTENWKGDVNQPCINLHLEVKAEGEIVEIEQLFTYNDQNGRTTYSPNSNLGRYKRKYGKLPESGDRVKIQTNGEGFGKIKLD